MHGDKANVEKRKKMHSADNRLELLFQIEQIEVV